MKYPDAVFNVSKNRLILKDPFIKEKIHSNIERGPCTVIPISEYNIKVA